jgi:hypothetical protein
MRLPKENWEVSEERRNKTSTRPQMPFSKKGACIVPRKRDSPIKNDVGHFVLSLANFS